MKILIISEARSGSSSLVYSLSETLGYKMYSEQGLHLDQNITGNSVYKEHLKTLLVRHGFNLQSKEYNIDTLKLNKFLDRLSSKFDHIVLLSRYSILDSLNSLTNAIKSNKFGPERPPHENLKFTKNKYSRVRFVKSLLNYSSIYYNIPIWYYEELFSNNYKLFEKTTYLTPWLTDELKFKLYSNINLLTSKYTS